jgi:tetratricopeptide (TPR) repeat protein
MSSSIRFSVLAAALLAPFAAGCGDRGNPTPTTTASTGAETPAAPTAAGESGSVKSTAVGTVVSEAAPASYADAETAFHRGRYSEAAELFASYTQSHPDNAWGHYMLGLSAWKSGQHETALEGFDEALRLDPNHRKSLLNSARVLLETSRPKEALERIEKALAIEPLSNDGLRLLGRARSELGQIPEAIDAYQRAIALDEKDVWAMNNLGYLHLQQGRIDEALPPLARAVELRSNAPVFQNNLGMALEQAGYFTAAKDAYQKAVAVDSSYSKASASLARIGERKDDPAVGSADVAALAQQFQAEIATWRDSTASGDSAEVGAMVRDTVNEDSTIQRDTVTQ